MTEITRLADTEHRGYMKKRVFNDNYDDIIGLSHHISPTRNRMSMIERAAQFSPFAALTGHEAAVKETARLTNERIELDENRKAILNEKLQIILEKLEDLPEITFTFFKPDERKSGGEYVEVTGAVKKIEEIEQFVRLVDGTKIPITEIYEIRGNIFME